MRVHCNKSQKTSQCVKNNNYATRVRVSCSFCSLDAVTSSVMITRTGKCNLLYI